MALLPWTGLSSAQAGSTPASAKVQTLAGLLAQARASEAGLEAQMGALKARLKRDLTEVSESRQQLAALISAEYQETPASLLAILASPSFDQALDTQLTLDRLTSAEKDSLVSLSRAVEQARRDQAQLAHDQSEEKQAEIRLAAEELVAEFQAENPPLQLVAPRRPGPSSSTRSASPTPGRTPTPVPPTPVPPTPTPAPSTPPAAAGTFAANTNLTQPSGISLAQIRAFLDVVPGDPLEADAGYLYQAEHSYHVSAIYLVADAVLETGWGTSSIYLSKHNLFGFEAYDSDPDGDAMKFASDQACIAYVAPYVYTNYLLPSGPYYVSLYGPTPQGMAQNYATAGDWLGDILTLGDQLQATLVQ